MHTSYKIYSSVKFQFFTYHLSSFAHNATLRFFSQNFPLSTVFYIALRIRSAESRFRAESELRRGFVAKGDLLLYFIKNVLWK